MRNRLSECNSKIEQTSCECGGLSTLIELLNVVASRSRSGTLVKSRL